MKTKKPPKKEVKREKPFDTIYTEFDLHRITYSILDISNQRRFKLYIKRDIEIFYACDSKQNKTAKQ